MRFLISALPLIVAVSANAQTLMEVNISVATRYYSHQNPWEPPKLKYSKANAIQVAKGEFLTIGNRELAPEFASVESKGESDGTKLKLSAYEPDTGLSLYSSKPFIVESKILTLENFKFEMCKRDLNETYAILENSEFPARVYRKAKGEHKSDNLIFQYKGNLCGIQAENHLLDMEYVRRFLFERKIGRIFPHAGLSVHFDLTTDELQYYFGGKFDGGVVEKVSFGIGPTETLFPFDKIIEVSGLPLTGSAIEKRKKFYNNVLFSGGHLNKIRDSVSFTLLKKNDRVLILYPLKQFSDNSLLIPEKFSEGSPKYFIEGGVAFTELTGSYLKESGTDYRRKSHKKLLYVYEYYKNKSHPFRDKLVIVSRILPHKFNETMRNLEDEMVQKANGENIRSLEHLFQIFKNTEKEILLEFANGEFFLFSKMELLEINANIKKLYSLSGLNNLEE